MPASASRPSNPVPAAGSGRTTVWVLTVIAATAAVYRPAVTNGLVWNDADYLTKPALRSWAGLFRIWTEPGATEQYYPLLHSFFWLQNRLWGQAPLGYHVVTLLLHLGAAILFALVLRRLAVPGAWLAALLFALHPVHVESVAWIAEQKNTLSLVFYLAAALAYLRFDESRGRKVYFAALGLFALSLLCKTVTATLPAALLVIVWWQRGRLDGRRDVRPLVPWLVIGAAAAAFTTWVEQHYLGARGDNFSLPLVGRGLVAGRAFWFYTGHLVWPFDLNFIYPRWTPDATVWWQWLFPLGVGLLALGTWLGRRRSRTPLAVFLIYAGSLFPVLGFVNLFGALYSWVWDHWQYLPDLAPLALMAAGCTRGCELLGGRARAAGPVLVAGLAAGLGMLTWQDTHAYRDEETLYRTVLAQNPAAWMAHNNLGTLLAAQPGHAGEAIAEFEAVLRLRPDHPGAHNNLGLLLAPRPGRAAEARAHFDEALRLRPDHYTARVNLANFLATRPGEETEAVAQYEEALRQHPEYAEAHVYLADVLARLPGREAGAAAHYREAIRLSPDYAIAHNNLAMLLATQSGQRAEALAQFATALRLDPKLAEAHSNLAMLLAAEPGREAEATAEFETAARLRPRSAIMQNNLAAMLSRLPGRNAEAQAHFEEALRLQPDYAQAHAGLARLLFDRAGQEAGVVAHCEQALQTDPNLAPAHYLLGAVAARQGRIEEAIGECRRALACDPHLAEARRTLDFLEARKKR